MSTPISLEAQTILNSLREKGYWESAGGTVQVQWLPDEGRGIIDVKNIEGVKGRKGYYKILRSVLPKLDVIAELPAEWQFNPDAGQKGRIYQMLGPKLKGNLTPNPDMPNNALTWNTKPTANPGEILNIQKGKRWANGAVPDSVAREEFAKYLERVEARDLAGKKRAKASFEHKGMKYFFESKGKTRVGSSLKAPNGKLYKVTPSARGSIKEAIRRARELGQTPLLSPWEWKAIDELYEFAAKNGYHVDHIKALANKGEHRLSNLQVLDAKDNLVKGARDIIDDFDVKMKGQTTPGPIPFSEWEKYLERMGRTELVREKLARNALGNQRANEYLNRRISKEEAFTRGELAWKELSGVGTQKPVEVPKLPSNQTLDKFNIDSGERYLRRDVDVTGKPMTEAQMAEELERIAAKNKLPLEDVSSLGKAMRRAGSILPFVGAGLDAWDVQQRWEEAMNNPNEGLADWLDKVQLGLATTTLGTSFWAEPANFALGMTNLGIDIARTIFEEDKREDFNRSMRAIGREGTRIARQLF